MIDSSMESLGAYMTGQDILSQTLVAVVILFLLYIILSVGEFTYNNVFTMWKDRVQLFPNTYASGSKMYTALQNPTNPDAVTIYFSDNQRSGVELSYSMFIYIKSDTFAKGEHKLYHILHKGYSNPYPLMGPGIFCWGDSNKIRVYMNCYDSWNNYVDVENIPVEKWFHVTVSCKGNTMYIYINGNLKKKMSLSNNTPPYQNYGNVYLFSTRTTSLYKNITTSLETDKEFVKLQGNSSLEFDGPMKGMVSRVFYFGYALTYTEIQALMSAGPSPVIEGNSMEISPYLSDTWWVNNQGP
jgi:hypothetical protein